MIEMQDIEKYHQSGPRKTYVLRYVNLNVGEGEFVSIMGPSGAGKSTLLHIMGMLDEPTAGSYRFLGAEVGGMGEKERTEIHRQHIGFVFQAYHLIDEQTVYENLEMPLLYQKVKGAERKARGERVARPLPDGGQEGLVPAPAFRRRAAARRRGPRPDWPADADPRRRAYG